MPELTVEYITGLREELKETWGKAHAGWVEWVKFFKIEHDIRAFEETQKRRLSYARSKILAMVDSQVTDNPRVTRKPQGEGAAHKAEADKVEKVAVGILRKGAQTWGLVPPFRTCALFLALLGYGELLVRLDSSRWPKKPRKGTKGYEEALERWERERRNAFPWVIEAPYPARVLLPPNEREPSFAVESATMYNWQIERDYGIGPHDGKLMGVTDTILYMDREQVGLVIGKEMVVKKRNPYKIVPYTHAYAGMGIEHPSSYSLGEGSSSDLGPAPEDLAVGLLGGNEEEIRAADELVTAFLHMALLSSYQTIYLPYAVDSASFQAARKKAGLGGTFQLPAGVDPNTIKYGDVPRLDPWVFQVLQTYLQGLEGGTFSGIVQGQIAPNVPTATGQAMLLGSSRLKFGLPLQQLNYMAGQCLGFIARMTEVIGDEFWVEGIPFSGKDFEGNYDFEVNFMAKDEASQMRRTAQNLDLLKVDSISLEKLIEETGESDVTGEMRRILVGKMLKDPALLGQIMQLGMQLAQKKVGVSLPPPTVVPVTPAVPPPGGMGQPQPFVQPPGGLGEAQQVQQGMEQIPGQGMERALP